LAGTSQYSSFDLSNITETTEYPEKPLEFISYRPSENLKFKFSEKPLTKPWGFFRFNLCAVPFFGLSGGRSGEFAFFGHLNGHLFLNEGLA
jgi:hypothetical protein